ncbi:MAG: hypothetical protein M3O34_09040 [Chloroflexota bacterium]|nr:hypothetical protein [Chloroflexota bacterium]
MLHPEVRRSGRRSDRGPNIVWSGLAGAAIAALLVGGGLFWASVWDALGAPTGTGMGAAAVTDPAPPVEDDGAIRLASVEHSPGELSPEGPDVPGEQTAMGTLEAPDVPQVQAAASVAAEEAVESETTADRVEGLAEIAAAGQAPGSLEEDPGSPGASATGDADGEGPNEADAAGEQVAEEGEQAPDKVEELTARLEDLTARMEELAARLEAPGASPMAQPSGVPVPGAGPARPEAARAGQESAATRPPWVLLPRPDPGSRVTAGPLVLEARARGEAPITQIRLLLDGVALPVALERRDDRTWRGQAATRVGPGSHAVVVAVVDAAGRTGSYRWRFDATAP